MSVARGLSGIDVLLEGVGCQGWWLVEDHDIELDGRVLAAVSTPGHTQGHFVFADR